jgi:arylsulfatase A-like enzyme
MDWRPPTAGATLSGVAGTFARAAVARFDRGSVVKIFRLLLTAALLPLLACSADKKAGEAGFGGDLNVLMIVVDTMGARHLGCFDPELTNSPNIDRLAREGVHFTRAYSTAPWTQPAVASTFTSLMPSDCGVTRIFTTLPDSVTTIAEVMRKRGRWTMGVTSNWIVVDRFGFGQGFEKLNDSPVAEHDAITDANVTDAAKLVLDRAGRRPFFLYVHYFDPHWHFNHHPDFDRTSGYTGELTAGMDIDLIRRETDNLDAEDLAYLENLYREEIAFTDHQIGRLLEHLEKLGLADNTLVVLTADHGEAFREHGWIGHTANLYDELIHVPLIFHLPGKLAPRQVDRPASLLDILPTLADIVGEDPAEYPWQGRSLVGQLDGSAGGESSRMLLSEVSYVSPDGWPSGDGQTKRFFWTSLRLGDLKLHHDLAADTWRLFDLGDDPLEQHDLWDASAEHRERLRSALGAWEAARGRSVAEIQTLDAEAIKQLRSLGYVN